MASAFVQQLLADPQAALTAYAFEVFVGAVVVFSLAYLTRVGKGNAYADKPSLLAVNQRVAGVDARSADYTAIHARAAATGDHSEIKANAQVMVDQYYDLATDFYEFGWGESFHFGHRYPHESLKESLVRHEYYLASRLGLQPGLHCLDVGCGVGGPARNIARFSGAQVTGLTINAYQVARGMAKVARDGLDGQVKLLQGDFMALPFAPETFDRAYAIEATCHAPDRTACFAQVFAALKPGGVFAGYEWVATPKMDWNNPAHRALKAEIEIGNGLPDITYAGAVVDALRGAGFVVEECRDLAPTSPVPWYQPFEPSYTAEGFKTTDLGIFLTHVFVTVLEFLHLAPRGTSLMHTNLTSGARGLHRGGSLGLFTPMLFFKAVKPAAAAAAAKAAAAAAPASPAALAAAAPASKAPRSTSRSRAVGGGR